MRDNEKNLEKVLEECKLSEEELKEFEQYIIEEDLLKAFTFVRAFLMLYHKCIKNHENLFTYTGGYIIYIGKVIKSDKRRVIMKKILSFLLVFVLVLSMSMNISMAKLLEREIVGFSTDVGPEDATISLADKTYPVKNGTILFINGEIIPEAEIIMDGGKAMLPLRLIAEKLGYEVGWNNKERKVTLVKGDKNLRVAIDKDDSNAKIFKDRSYVLASFVEKNLAESAVVTEGLAKDFKKFYDTNMPITQDKTIERSLRNVIIDEKHEYKDNISSDDAMKLVKEKCLEGLKNFEKVMKEKAKDEPGKFDDDIKLIEEDINRMIYIGEVSKFYRYTIGPYDVLYDRTDGKIYFQIYSAESIIKEMDVNDPNLYLAIFIVG